MHADMFPAWTTLPFVAIVLAIAVLPIVAQHAWEKRGVQLAVIGGCSLPVIFFFVAHQRAHEIVEPAKEYFSFVSTLGALYVTSGGIRLKGDLEGKPATNVAILLVGALLASVVGTTGAAMLLIRPFLATNRQREHRAHLVPFFIIAVANAGGLLTPLGDPPLLVGYLAGVPFFWTLRLFPAWLLYVGSTLLALFIADRRAYARETAAAKERDRAEIASVGLEGKRNVALLLAVVPAALLPSGAREASMVALALFSYFGTPKALHTANGFSFGPIADVAIVFAGLFLCLGPVSATLAQSAPRLPIHGSWQLFWASGLLSAVLDNAPTYTAFAALARGLSSSSDVLVAGIDAWKLAAVSIGSVVMGATTYIGNGPNLMVKAIAERERFPTPSFARYAIFAFLVMAPAHAVMTLTFLFFSH